MRDDSVVKSPWLCAICGDRGEGEGSACALCYMVVCPSHLQRQPVFNAETGLYELQPVCSCCRLLGDDLR